MTAVHECRQRLEERHEDDCKRQCEVSVLKTSQHIETHSLWMQHETVESPQTVTAETGADMQTQSLDAADGTCASASYKDRVRPGDATDTVHQHEKTAGHAKLARRARQQVKPKVGTEDSHLE